MIATTATKVSSATTLLLVAAVVAAASSATALQQDLSNQMPVIPTSLPPRPLDDQEPSFERAPGAPAQEKAIWPVVDVDRQENKSTVDVHVPIFFDMTNHKDAETGQSKLDLSVLHGLVTVNKDRRPDSSGQMTGPLKVTVFGIPVYQGKAHPIGPQRELDNSIGQTRSALNERMHDVSNNVRQTNDKFMSGLSDLFGRLTAVVRQSSHSLAEPSASYIQPAREQRQRELHPAVYERTGAAVTGPPAILVNRVVNEARVEHNQIERSPVLSIHDERQQAAAMFDHPVTAPL